MVVIIPLSEKVSKKQRTITITQNILLPNQEFELLKMLSNNKFVDIGDMEIRLRGRKTLSNNEYVRAKISKLRGYGFNIERHWDRYRCTDEIFIK